MRDLREVEEEEEEEEEKEEGSEGILFLYHRHGGFLPFVFSIVSSRIFRITLPNLGGATRFFLLDDAASPTYFWHFVGKLRIPSITFLAGLADS